MYNTKFKTTGVNTLIGSPALMSYELNQEKGNRLYRIRTECGVTNYWSYTLTQIMVNVRYGVPQDDTDVAVLDVP